MDTYQTFYVQKMIGSFSDALLAFGLAGFVLNLMEGQGGGDITLTDTGTHYRLDLSSPLRVETIVQEASAQMPIPAIASERAPVSPDIRQIDYDDYSEQVSAYYEHVKNLKKGDERPGFPIYHWDEYRAIKDFNKFNIQKSYNSLIELWYTYRVDPETTFILLDTFADPVNDMDHAIERWQALSKHHGWGMHTKSKYENTALQIFNPDAGKGQNSPSVGLSIGNVSNFWLLEFLKAVGFYECAIPKPLPQSGSTDFKTLVLAPRNFSMSELRAVMSAFRQHLPGSSSSIRLDLIAAMQFTKELLNRLSEPDRKRRRRTNLRQHIVAGFETAFYKSMGNALASMNLSFVALPGWITIDDDHSPAFYRTMLDELLSVVAQLDESHSDDFTLLQHLRDFISGDDLRAFFSFTDLYPTYLIKARQKGNYRVKQLSLSLVERIIMSTEPNYAEVIENPSFKRIASAIRHATVIAQIRSNSKEYVNYPYQVRYGLHQDLLRKANSPDTFIEALSEFIASYNAETSRVYELALKAAQGDKDKVKISGRRFDVSQPDLYELANLMHKYNPKSVAKLLVACGTASVGKKDSTKENQE